MLNTSAQINKKKATLKEIITLIEKQHHISFNYTEENITYEKIIPPSDNLSLQEKLKYLEQETKLSFENINNKFINIFSTKNAKKICGFVRSSLNNQLVENVSIITLHDDRSTFTNHKGYFELKKEKDHSLLICHPDYTDKKMSISDLENKDCVQIFLDPKITALKEVTVNHFLTTGIVKKQNGFFEIKPKEFGILPGLIEPDVLQTMQQIPGINSADESIASINVRGGTHDQNLFLWNGIKMYQTGHFFGLITAFNPNLAHTISIYKNGSPAFYGESVSSVIDISSNPTKIDKNNFSAGINMINADIYTKFNLSKKSFLEIASRKSITDFVESPTYREYFNKVFQNTSITDFSSNKNINYSSDKKFNFYDITIKYFQKIGLKDQLIIDLITINDELNVFQSTANNNIVQFGNNTLYQKNYGANLSWKRNWNTKNTSHINIYNSYYELVAQKSLSQNNQSIKQENRVLDTGFKLENNYVINPRFRFNSGYQFNEIQTTNLDDINEAQFFKKTKDVLRIHALVTEWKFNDIQSKIAVNGGLRLNYIENFKNYMLEPRLQFTYTINKHLNLELLGEFKSQNCQQTIELQKDYFGIEKRRWILANNTTIPTQKSKQISLGVSYTKDNWLFSLENFYKKVIGITSSSQGFQNQLEFLKIVGNYTVVGTEVLLQKKINHFLTWLSYTFNDNNYNFPDFQPSVFSNNFEMDHVISWAGIYETTNLKIALGSKWYSGRPETTPVNSESNSTIIYNTPNNKYLEDFIQVNFSTTYRWKNSKGVAYKLGLSVLNIFDHKNEISEYYRSNTAINSIEDVKTFSLQRTPNLSFRVVF